MNARDRRLRELLRAADPARDAAELSAAEVARMRRSVLAVADAETRSCLAWPTLAFAVAAVVALALSVVLWRTTALPESTASGAQATTSSGDPAPASKAVQQSSPRPTPLAARSVVAATPRPTPDVPLLEAAAPSAPHRSAPSTRRRATTTADARTDDRRDLSAPREAPSPTDPTAPDTVVAAQPEREPRPYQIQLTAPGGTRIVWLLTAPSG